MKKPFDLLPFLYLLSQLLSPVQADDDDDDDEGGDDDDGPNPGTATFVDPLTGFTMQRFFGARTSFGFAMALPLNPSTDFIGQISAPMPNNNGWAGVGMTGEMEGPLLIAAWPNTATNPPTVMSTFRVSQDEDQSPPQARGNFAIKQIDQGTVLANGQMTFTFLCQNCITGGELGFGSGNTGGIFEMGWGLSNEKVSNPADPAASMGFHNVGFGGFDANLGAARTQAFGDFALLAGGSTSNGSTTPVAAQPVATQPDKSGGTTNNKDGDDDDDKDDD
ncbi:hypothetical protein BGZ60DRAFT_515155 [Tricladium varicosporioides]|nr:hypothetical protein BGZ60DRAFT_515155 [Hymenoscyphus varicosporioides]